MLLVMPHTGADDKLTVVDFENQSVCFVDANTPPIAEVALKRLGFADRRVTVAIDALNQRVDSLQGLAIARRPILKLLPSEIRPQLLHVDDLSGSDEQRASRLKAEAHAKRSSSCHCRSLSRQIRCAPDRREDSCRRELQKEGLVGRWFV